MCTDLPDVDGIYTADPRIVPDARHLETGVVRRRCSGWRLWCQVLMLRCVRYARRYNVPVHVRSSYSTKPAPS